MRQIVGGILLLLLLLPACLTGSAADKTLLTNVPCPPPCWQGITPGVTNVQEALSVVRTLPFVDPNSVTFGRDGWDDSMVSLHWTDKGFNGAGDIRARRSDGIVVEIMLTLPTPIRLGEIVHVQGNPTLVRVKLNADGPPSGTFAYPDKGVILEALTVPRASTMGKALISRNSRVTHADYFSPMALNQMYIVLRGWKEADVAQLVERFQPWPGLDGEVDIR